MQDPSLRSIAFLVAAGGPIEVNVGFENTYTPMRLEIDPWLVYHRLRCAPFRHVHRQIVRIKASAEVLEADVDQEKPVEAPQAAQIPSEGGEQSQQSRDAEPRRRPPQGGNRRPKREQLYQISDLVIGQEVDATVVSVPSVKKVDGMWTSALPASIYKLCKEYATGVLTRSAGEHHTLRRLCGHWLRQGCAHPHLPADGKEPPRGFLSLSSLHVPMPPFSSPRHSTSYATMWVGFSAPLLCLHACMRACL